MTETPSSVTGTAALLPTHIALVPDGNGRWAQQRGLPRLEGHREGIDNMFRMVEYVNEYHIPYLTLYGFSTENWRRPDEEVYGLFEMLTDFIARVGPEVRRLGIRLRHIGRSEGLPDEFREAIIEAVDSTSMNTGMNLNIAFNYGGRAELTDAVRHIITEGTRPEEVTEKLIESHLYTAGMPEVDLMIRTGDEYRLSNFLIWQSTYAEVYFSTVLWPDFGKQDIEKALEFYRSRKRRFGGL